MLSVPVPELFAYSAESLTRRILKEGLPKISLHFKKLGHERSDGSSHPVFFLWSRDKPDWRANLQALDSSDAMRAALLAELKNFERQLTVQRKMLKGLEAVYRGFLRESQSGFDVSDLFRKRTRRHGLSAGGWETDDETVVDPTFTKGCERLTDQELRDLAEKMRAEVKRMQARVRVVRAAAWATCRFAAERPPFNKKNWIALCAYWSLPRTEVTRKAVREGLAYLRLPAERISEQRQYGKTRCFGLKPDGEIEIREENVRRHRLHAATSLPTPAVP